MPRKINKRKKLQAERRKAERALKPKPKQIGMIAHSPYSGGAMATLLAMALMKRGDQ